MQQVGKRVFETDHLLTLPGPCVEAWEALFCPVATHHEQKENEYLKIPIKS